jgi:hypothetical protein
MATPAGRIEKEFLLKVLYDEDLPIMYNKDGTDHILTLEQPAKEALVLRPEKPIGKLKPHTKLGLLFDYRGQVIHFTAEITAVKDELIICKVPQALYKNLDRNYLRVDAPSDLKILFSFRGDRYNLSFPKIMEYENTGSDNFFQSLDRQNLSGLMKQMTPSLKKYSDGYRIVNFKDKKPETLEERILSETGKTLFLPSTVGSLPKTDPYPKKRIVTEDIFKRYMESTGVDSAFIDESYARFLRNKYNEGIFSDAWIPILFQEYVIGYIHIWINKEGRPPIDFSALDNIYQFAKVLAFSLEENGYFEYGKMHNESFEGRVLDISASGLLFAYPYGNSLSSTLLLGAELTVNIEAPNRSINVIAKIIRRFKDKTTGYYGCRYVNLVPEDMRFLFEHLYGRQIDDTDTAFLTGQV